ncbi:unnamed protein product, partial [marine sediment metagenome]
FSGFYPIDNGKTYHFSGQICDTPAHQFHSKVIFHR